MKDIIKAIVALIFVAVLAFFVFYNGEKSDTIQKNIGKNYIPQATIDISIPVEKTNQLEIYLNGNKVEKDTGDWSKEYEWYVLQTQQGKMTITLKSKKTNSVTLTLRGPWVPDSNGKPEEHWVRFNSVKIDDKNILTNPKEVWQDAPYDYTFLAKKDKTYTIEATWEPK